jgi:hypothetical protein
MSLLRQSGQTWKVSLFIGMLVIGSLATFLEGVLNDPLGDRVALWVAWGGVGLIIASIFWGAQAVVCPKCDLKLFVYAFRNQGFFTWFAWVLQTETCPGCGHGSAPRSAASRRKPKGLKRP